MPAERRTLDLREPLPAGIFLRYDPAMPLPARNIELKARLRSLASARQVAEGVATSRLGRWRQVDTYFDCPHGRLKLREEEGRRAEWIWYHRPDAVGEKPSDYRRMPIDPVEVAADKALFANVLGVRSIVDKVREVFLVDNVRIHLDEVVGLGEFLELEAVLGEGIDDATGSRQTASLRESFSLRDEDLVAMSYGDLLGQE